MKRLALFILALVLVCHSAFAAGGDGYLDGATATGYSGHCTASGNDNGRVVPLCDTAGDGFFYLPYTFTSGLSSPAQLKIGEVQIVNTAAVPSGNLCAAISGYVVTNGGLGGSTQPYNASAAVSTPTTVAIAGNCTAANSTCYQTADSAFITAWDLGQGAPCSGAACTDKKGWIRVVFKTVGGSGCTGGVASSSSNLFALPWFKIVGN